jgi:PKD repeat protein
MTSLFLVIRSGHRRCGLLRDLARRSGHLTAVSISVAVLAACTLGSPSAPALSGPSELGTSLAITASPDLIVRDGVTQSVITVTARDANSQPIRNLTLRMDVVVGDVLGDLGTLSARTISTGNDGRATITYTAPPAAALGVPNEATIKIFATPVGTDFANTVASSVSIRLTSPGVIQPPNGAPVASFFASPTSARESETVTFDGAASTDADGRIVSYRWSFGDGDTEVTTTPTVRHDYHLPGSYLATLTVTDDRGLTGTSAPVAIDVAASTSPVAAFVISPTESAPNQPVNVNGTASTAASGHQIVAWTWDFGEGLPSETRQVPTFTYPGYKSTGKFTIVLTVTDDLGRQGTTSMVIEIK